MVTGCLLCGAPAASAQPLAAVAPISTAQGGGPYAPGPAAVGHKGVAGATPQHGRTPPGPADHADHAAKGEGPPSSAKQPHGAHSLQLSATRELSPQVTTTTTSGGTAATRQALFARAPATSTPQASTSLSSQPSQPSNGNGNGNGNGKTKTDNAKRIRTTDNNGGNSRTTANGKGNGSRAAPAPGTPAAETAGAPLPAQRPVRPERFFSIPLAPLSPIPAVGGPLPGSALPLAPARKAGSELFRFGASVLPRTWAGDSLKESGKLKLPLALMAATALFMLVQALVDRRDPKVSDAPERPTDDTVGFG